MSEAIPSNLLRRIRFTPMRDVMRGKLSGRLDVKQRIATAPIPAAARELIARVVARTRLWRAEKIDVADDLIAHFAAGLEVGATLDGLVQYFGDERIAAQLLGRAKRRNRSLIQRALVITGWLFCAIVAFYIGLGVYFFSGTPSVKVNYVDVLNQQTEQTPPDQRGWPLYRQAMLSFGDQSDRMRSSWPNIWATHQSPELASWLHQHADSLDLIRQAAAKPTLGYLLSASIRPEDAPLFPQDAAMLKDRSGDTPLMSIYLPYLNTLGFAQGLLDADARLARSERDQARFVRDIDALMDLSRQMRSDLSSFRDNILISARFDALREIAQTLEQSPNFLADNDLQHLAHRLAEPRSAADLIDLRAGSPYVLDALQRIYSDDGAGNGRVTPAGLRFANPTRRWIRDDDRALRGVVWPSS